MVEIGCGAGGNPLFLRRQLANLQVRFLGFDINAEVIASNGHLNSDELRFEVKDCFNADLDVSGDLGVIFCGVLMYAREEDIRRLLLRITDNCPGRVLVGISEPALDPEAASASAHNNLALRHGYRRIFREANFRLLFETVRGESGKQAGIYHALFDLPR